METNKTDLELVKELKQKLRNLTDTVARKISEWDEKEFVLAHPPGTTLTHPEEAEYFSLVEQMEKILQTSTTLPEDEKKFYQNFLDIMVMIWIRSFGSANLCRQNIVMKRINEITTLDEASNMVSKLAQIIKDNGEWNGKGKPQNMDSEEYESVIGSIETLFRMFPELNRR
jgi:hypothetical protein